MIVALFIVAGMGVLGWHVLRQMEPSQRIARSGGRLRIRNTMPGLKTTDPAQPRKHPPWSTKPMARPSRSSRRHHGKRPVCRIIRPHPTPPPSLPNCCANAAARRLSGEAPAAAPAARQLLATRCRPGAQRRLPFWRWPRRFGWRAGHAPTMADRLSPVRLSAARAGQVGSMDMLLLQSAMIDCAMNVRVDSSVQA